MGRILPFLVGYVGGLVVVLVYFYPEASPHAILTFLLKPLRASLTMINLRTVSALTYLTRFVFLGCDAHSNSSSLLDIVPKREVLYVGGEYTNITVSRGCLFTMPTRDLTRRQDHVTNITSLAMIGQIYVEKLSPHPAPANPPLPMIFIAGAGQTGTNFLTTPDGRPGWASYFISKGHTVYLSDQPMRGRSAWSPIEGNMTTLGPPSVVSDLFTNSEGNGKQWPQAKLHTQWPGTGRMGDATFDNFYRSQVPFRTDAAVGEERNAKAYSALVDVVGECFVVSHSQAGAYGKF
jgi:hypothetical protein